MKAFHLRYWNQRSEQESFASFFEIFVSKGSVLGRECRIFKCSKNIDGTSGLGDVSRIEADHDSEPTVGKSLRCPPVLSVFSYALHYLASEGFVCAVVFCQLLRISWSQSGQVTSTVSSDHLTL
ncbi:hypothetical protein T265_07387 [Opisthorchis viverrini]|uniref:Uncharacterized protein n=1 Tax=Opisthorchis viverrini TaxID=6198 RepID=A0A074ZP42_OPIVI|nr:hypothetical protein T265_07387 [Opisthorchis viverrini]KER25100.1 hypothetical protein T265_07387 [Opisthorchis viverrini]